MWQVKYNFNAPPAVARIMEETKYVVGNSSVSWEAWDSSAFELPALKKMTEERLARDICMKLAEEVVANGGHYFSWFRELGGPTVRGQAYVMTPAKFERALIDAYNAGMEFCRRVTPIHSEFA